MTIEDHLPLSPPGLPKSRQGGTISNGLVCSTLLPAGYPNNATVAPDSGVSPPVATAFIPPSSMSSSTTPTPPNYSLLVYSTDLGRLPVYGQFNIMDTVAVPQQKMEEQIQTTASEGSENYWNHQQGFQPTPALPPTLHCDMPMLQSDDDDDYDRDRDRGQDSWFSGMMGGVGGSQVMPLSFEGQWKNNGNDIDTPTPLLNNNNDDNIMAMWTNAPTSFEYVFLSGNNLRLNFFWVDWTNGGHIYLMLMR